MNCDKQGIRNSLTPCVVCPRPEPQGSRKNSPVQDLPKKSFHLSSHLRFLLLSTDRNLLDEDLPLPAVDACESSDGP